MLLYPEAMLSLGEQSALPVPPTNQSELRYVLAYNLLHNTHWKLPIDSLTLMRLLKKEYAAVEGSLACFRGLEVDPILKEWARKDVISAERITIGLKEAFLVLGVNSSRLKEVLAESDNDKPTSMLKVMEMQKREKSKYSALEESEISLARNLVKNFFNVSHSPSIPIPVDTTLAQQLKKTYPTENELDHLLKKPTAKQASMMKSTNEITTLLQAPTAKEKIINEQFKTKGGIDTKRICPYATRVLCNEMNDGTRLCDLVHFKKFIQSHTDASLGDCPKLNMCPNMETCNKIHYIPDESNGSNALDINGRKEYLLGKDLSALSQWINCDIRYFEMSIIGKFDVVIADPPWDIHMDLPYGTMKDEEMKALRIGQLQDSGIIFLWVTGRAMEVGRECLEMWGYKMVEEIIWVKLNQMQKIIRTGRTGHWLNHSKEHCLVGVKGGSKLNQNIDCDVIVSEVRETSRKPDELYAIAERVCPGGRKMELFARPHNRRPGWFSIGNQLPGNYVYEEEVTRRWNQKYPENPLIPEQMEKNRLNEIQEIEGSKAEERMDDDT